MGSFGGGSKPKVHTPVEAASFICVEPTMIQERRALEDTLRDENNRFDGYVAAGGGANLNAVREGLKVSKSKHDIKSALLVVHVPGCAYLAELGITTQEGAVDALLNVADTVRQEFSDVEIKTAVLRKGGGLTKVGR